jgi:predicted MFS family arabinose efflux permease
MKRLNLQLDRSVWTSSLIILMTSVFIQNFGQGLFRASSTNFFVDTLGMSGKEVMWLQGLREVPGLALIGIAAVTMHMRLIRRVAWSAVLMGVGYGLYAVVNSYTGLVAVAIIASLGFHIYFPLESTLALSLVKREQAGRVMGFLSSSRALASIAGMGAVIVVAQVAESLSLRWYFVLGGALTIAAGLLLLRIPSHVGKTETEQPRLLLRRRYWLYYVLILFEGTRTQVFGSFGTLILVQHYGMTVGTIGLVLLGSSIVNLIGAPIMGNLLDRYGERRSLSWGYVALALCFVGYATVHNAFFLTLFLIGINLLVTLSMGLSTYVRRIAPEEELMPTLAAGVSINHVTSVGMSLLVGSLLALVGYEALCWGAAVIILLSVPFALSIQVEPKPTLAPAATGAE